MTQSTATRFLTTRWDSLDMYAGGRGNSAVSSDVTRLSSILPPSRVHSAAAMCQKPFFLSCPVALIFVSLEQKNQTKAHNHSFNEVMTAVELRSQGPAWMDLHNASFMKPQWVGSTSSWTVCCCLQLGACARK